MAYALMRFMGLARKENKGWYFVWMCITSLAFLLHNFYIIFGFLILLKLFWVKNDLDKNILLFLFLFPCLPTIQSYRLPVDSIHILSTNYREALILILFLPLVPKLISKSSIEGRNIIFYIPLLYMVGTDIYDAFRSEINLIQTKNAIIMENTWTNKIRGLISVIIFKYLPFYVAAVWCITTRKLMKALHAIASSGVILMILAVPCALFGWDIYHQLSLGGYLPNVPLYDRGLFIRVKLTLIHPIVFGKFAFMTLCCLLGLLMMKGFKLKTLILAILITAPAIYFTGSRSAYIGIALAVLGYMYYSMGQHSRKLASCAIIISLLSLTIPYIIDTGSIEATDFSSLDNQGTFEYRKRLLIAGMEVIPQNPFLGNRNYVSEPEFLALRQGEGIVDTLNKWLIMTLEYGLVYTALFLLLILRTLRSTRSLAIRGLTTTRYHEVSIGAAMSACLVAFSITAFFDAFSGYLYIFLGLCIGIESRLMDLTYNRKKELVANNQGFNSNSLEHFQKSHKNHKNQKQ